MSISKTTREKIGLLSKAMPRNARDELLDEILGDLYSHRVKVKKGKVLSRRSSAAAAKKAERMEGGRKTQENGINPRNQDVENVAINLSEVAASEINSPDIEKNEDHSMDKEGATAER